MIVGICDGEKEAREKLHKICENVFIESDVNGKVVEFESGEDALSYSDELTILLLGQEMPQMNGMDVLRKFRAMGKQLIIIYDASCRRGMCATSGMHVLGFVELENAEWQLPVMLKEVLMRAEHFVVLEGGIDSREILYIKSEPPYCRLVLENEMTRNLRVSLKCLEERLEKVDFVRVHRSYLVNFLYVENVQDDVICVQSNTLPVAVRRRAGIKKTYERFYREFARRRRSNATPIFS